MSNKRAKKEPFATLVRGHKLFELKVLKVFSAKNGKAIFRAYLVKWKNQKVVASDVLAKTDYKVGDTITVLVMKHPHPNEEEKHGLLAFQIMQ